MRSCLVIAVRIAQQDGVQVLRLLQIPRRWLLGAVDKTCIKHAILLCCGYGVILLDLDWDCLMLKPVERPLQEGNPIPVVFQNIDPPSPSPPGEFVLPPQQRRGVHTRPAEKGWGGQYFGIRQE
jgi:hypothetical protein